jgi:hypothetical protein
MLLHINPQRSSASRFPWRLHIHWGDQGTFKEEQHPRKKGGQFAKKGAGETGGGKEIPAPPQIKSQHATNIGKQKHLNQLHQHAKAGEWGKVEAYPTPGSNTYAKMVQKYKADLLKQKPAEGAEPAKISPMEITKAAQAKGFEVAGVGQMVNPTTGHVLTAKPEGPWEIKEKNGKPYSSGGSFETLKNALNWFEPEPEEEPEPAKIVPRGG